MIETHSLVADNYLKDISLVVSDIDYTLANFLSAHYSAMDAVEKRMGKKFTEALDHIYQINIEERMEKDSSKWSKKEEYQKILDGLSELSSRKWSREAWVLYTVKKLGIDITNKEVEEIRDIFWKAVADNTPLYEDTEKFLEILHKRNIPIILMTSSDGIMNVQEDLTLKYDPEFSRRYKEKRVKKLPINYISYVIGDPYDKPDIRFFKIVEREIEKLGNSSKESILFVGDSMRTDLEVPEKLGYKTLLVKRPTW